MVALTYGLRDALHANNLDDFGSILHEGWILKKMLTDNISSCHVDTIYEQGIAAGASGGKLLGAGGGGFILFYCSKEKQEKFCDAMKAYRILPFKFDNFGSKLIYMGENDYHGF
jgi:D-glycero-alpha-D-manno-heptose-7-phosphate kinase